MKEKTAIAEKQQAQLQRLKAMRDKPEGKYYALGVFFLVVLLHVIDEICTNAGGFVQSSVVNEFFVTGMGMSFNEGLAVMSSLGIVSLIVQLVGPFYKSLADKWGRKPFLILNTVGMGLGLLLCGIAPNVAVYILGSVICTFFICHDMQVVYILEAAPEKYRTTFYGTTKCIGTLALVLVPFFRDVFMGDDPTKWRSVFLVPVVIAVIVAVAAITIGRETKVYLNQKIAKLENRTLLEPEEAKKAKKDEKSGVGAAFKYIFKSKSDLKWLLLGVIIFYTGVMAMSSYAESIMTTSGMSTQQVTDALYIYPFVFAGLIFISGFLGDIIGRKMITCLMGAVSLVSFVLFITACSDGWSTTLVGLFYGLYLGSYFTAGDYFGVLASEKSPTHLRASIAGALGLCIFVSTIISNIACIILMLNFTISTTCLIVSAPAVVLGVALVLIKVKETKGTQLSEAGQE